MKENLKEISSAIASELDEQWEKRDQLGREIAEFLAPVPGGAEFQAGPHVVSVKKLTCWSDCVNFQCESGRGVEADVPLMDEKIISLPDVGYVDHKGRKYVNSGQASYSDTEEDAQLEYASLKELKSLYAHLEEGLKAYLQELKA